MDKLELIIEGILTEDEERYIENFCDIRHKIELLGMYIIEIPEGKITELEQFSGINSINMATQVMTQA